MVLLIMAYHYFTACFRLYTAFINRTNLPFGSLMYTQTFNVALVVVIPSALIKGCNNLPLPLIVTMVAGSNSFNIYVITTQIDYYTLCTLH